MASLEIIGTLKTEAVNKLGELEAVKATVQARIENLDKLQVEMAAEMKAAEEKGYEEGLKAAGQAGGSDKLYSDAEMNQFLADKEATVRGELQPQIDDLSAKVAALEAAQAAVPAQITNAQAEAVAAFKAELKAKYDEQQVAETAGETGFSDMLK